MTTKRKSIAAPHLTYSRDADALAIALAPGMPGHRVTRELTPQIHADFIGDQLVAFEIHGASELIPKTYLAAMKPPVDEVSLEEAAREIKRSVNTLRILLREQRITGGRKVGRSWVVPRAALWEYLDSLAPTGRPTADRRAPRRKRVGGATAGR
jgi:hypothetical protein